MASFEHFGLVPPFNMAAMIVFTSEGDIFRLERTDTPHVKMPKFTAEKTCLQPGSKIFLIYVANLAYHDKCEGGDFYLYKSSV